MVKNNDKFVYRIKKSKQIDLSVKMNNKSIYQWKSTTDSYQLNDS